MTWLRRQILTCLFLIACALAVAQNGTLRGQVTNADDGQPVSFVFVAIESLQKGVLSDEDGYFVLSEVPPGEYTVSMSRIGFREVKRAVVVRESDTTSVVASLSALSLVADEVVVTASLKSQVLNLAPASASVVSSAELNRRTLATFDQAVDFVPGVVVSRTSGSNVQSLSIRGASETAGGGTGNRVLLLIDGRPALSPESGGALWNLVPLNSLERIEVVKGAYSALYGSSAMGGVINAITRKPGEKPSTTVHLNYGVFDKLPGNQEYNPFRDFHAMELSHSGSSGQWSYLFDVARRQNDGHREKSSFSLLNTYGKVTYDFAPNRTLQLSGNYNKLNNDTPATWLSRQQPFEVADHRRDDNQSKQESSIDLYYSAVTNNQLKYSSRFYHYRNFQEFTFNDDPDNDSTNVNTGKQFIDRSSIRTSRLGNFSQVDLAIGDAHYALAGIDVKYDRTTALPDTVLYGRHNALEFGVFVQDEWTITDRLTLTGGARFDYYEIIDEYSEINFSPKIAFVYEAGKQLSVRGLFARAFRNPSIAERFIKFEQGGGLTFEPNPDLVSEKLSISGELGVNMKVGRRLELDAAVFYNRYKDLISFIQISAPTEPLTFRVVNLKTAVMQGADIALTYRPCDWFTARAGYAYLDARDTSPNRFNDNLAYKAKHSVMLGGDAHYRNLHVYLRARSRSRIEEVFIYPDSSPSGYILLDLKCSYDFSPTTQVYIASNNMSNTQYEELERYRMPGRSYTAGLRLDF